VNSQADVHGGAMTAAIQLQHLWRERHRNYEAQSSAWDDSRATHIPLTAQIIAERASSDEMDSPYPSDTGTLLITVGFSPDQVALGINQHVTHWKCLKVLAFAPTATWNDVQARVLEVLSLCSRDWTSTRFTDIVTLQPLDNESDPSAVFAAMAQSCRSLVGGIAIDCTGGKKPVVSAAAHVASYFGFPAYYLDFDNYDPRLRRPLPWTNRYRRLMTPDGRLMLENRRAIVTRFEEGRFDEALHGIDDLLAGIAAELQSEQGSFQAARLKVVAAANWLNARYCDAGGPLAQVFPQNPVIDPNEAQKLADTLLSNGEHLLEFLADEFWRLELFHGVGDYRAVVVRHAGIVELLIEHLFRQTVRGKWPGEWPDGQSHQKKRVLLGKSAQLYRGDDGSEVSASGAGLTLSPQLFGYPHDSAWGRLRNKVVHIGAIVGKGPAIEAQAEAERWIEVLFRTVRGQDLDLGAAGSTEWVTWKNDINCSRETRAPWLLAPMKNQLRVLLSVPEAK